MHFADGTDRPHLDAADPGGRNLRGDLYGLVEIAGLDQVEPGELLLGLGERPVGDGYLALAHAHGRRGLDGLQGLRGDAAAARAKRGVVVEAMPVIHRLQLGFFAVDQAEVFHGGSNMFQSNGALWVVEWDGAISTGAS